MKNLNYDKDKIIQTFMRAHEIIPTRAEALYGAINFCRTNGLNQQGYILGKYGIDIKYPEGSLFIEKWIYDYALIDEFSIVAYWAGFYEESKKCCEKLLNENLIPNYYIDRVKSNLEFALAKLS